MSRRFVLLVVLLAAFAAPLAAQTLQVAPLPRDGQVLVSFKLDQELTDEIRTAIHSGMNVSFVYKVDLRRSSSIWVDRTIASVVVRSTVKYDNLTRRYALTRTVDGRMERPETTDSEELAWAWLTSQFDRLPLFRSVALENNGEYYVRVRAHTAPRNAPFVWPWQGEDVVGLTKFTLIR
ncbi:MAG TPA: DUF4390 domain-containing protein [Vicinamibacterales bacterium]|nr:DUF4390 domain-containing protein [Vicinamibacterales bacterium]